MMSALPLASARLSKLWILCLNYLLDGYLCKKKFLFPYFLLFFWFYNVIFSDALILPISQLQTELVMTSQIRSHIEYLIQTYYILLLNFQSKLMKKSSLNGGFNAILWRLVIMAYFFGPPCRVRVWQTDRTNPALPATHEMNKTNMSHRAVLIECAVCLSVHLGHGGRQLVWTTWHGMGSWQL